MIRPLDLFPNPVLPTSGVLVTATAGDALSDVTGAELFLDNPGANGTSPFPMLPQDGAWDSKIEVAVWFGTYQQFTEGLLPGPHVLLVHAVDAPGNWGGYATLPFQVGDPSVTGPVVFTLDLTPANLSQGADLAVNATIYDAFGSVVRRAEWFLDAPGADGAGTLLAPTDLAWDESVEETTWTGPLLLSPGDHTVWVHGQNSRGLWGDFRQATFTVRAPAFTLRLLADQDTARPNETRVYSLLFENRGNANATVAWINVTLPDVLTFVTDTAAAAGGVNTGNTRYVFANLPPRGYTFAISARVLETATDGIPLGALAVLDFTNEKGWDFAPVSASASGTVVAPEVRLSASAPTKAFAGEPLRLAVRFDHTGIRNIPSLDLSLDRSDWTEFAGDTAATVGGMSVGPGRWRFSDIAPGAYAFEVTERVRTAVADGLSIRRMVGVSYTSRSGTAVFLPTAFTVEVARPLFTISATPDRREVVEGGRIAFAVDFVNQGSVAAGTVRLAVTLPKGLALAGGDPPTTSSGGEHAWIRTGVDPGPHRLTVEVTGRGAGASELLFELAYTSPNGVELDRLRAPSTIVVREAPPQLAVTFTGLTLLGAAAAAGGFLATERGKVALLFGLVPLYTRLRREHVLDHETRGMIRGYILANPGDHYNAIRETLELPNGTLAYHLSVLEKEVLVRSVKDGKFRRFYPAEMKIPVGGEPTKIQKVVLDLIRANPGITLRDAAGLLGLTSSTVSYHLDRLEELGKIEYRREGISKRLFVKGDLEA